LSNRNTECAVNLFVQPDIFMSVYRFMLSCTMWRTTILAETSLVVLKFYTPGLVIIYSILCWVLRYIEVNFWLVAAYRFKCSSTFQYLANISKLN